jgi:SAM-dependent methyltransferase
MDIKGNWTTREEVATHEFDEPLCAAINFYFKDGVHSIIDVGCGNGSYTRYLYERGYWAEGYDGSPLTPELSKGLCRVMDFSEPVLIGEFDLVLCLEVGEHIPKQYEQTFIDNLCNLAIQWIVLSWALPGQGGTGHVNCQTNEYVIAEMAKRDFLLNEGLTTALRDEARLGWFKDTLMIFEWKS